MHFSTPVGGRDDIAAGPAALRAGRNAAVTALLRGNGWRQYRGNATICDAGNVPVGNKE